MKVPLKKKREKGYYSCLDFDILYKKKKKIKLKYSVNRDKNFSDTELFDKKKFYIKKRNGYVYKQKHFIKNNKDDKKLYLFNNVAIYKNYFNKYCKKNDEKLENLKKILKIYENVTTNEKKKLYELIKFFSFTQGGFQNNKLRQKLWLLLLGFNINLSKEKNYNDHPISILCRKKKKKFKYINSLKYFKLKWINDEEKNKSDLYKFNSKKIKSLDIQNKKNIYFYNTDKKEKKKIFNNDMKYNEEIHNLRRKNRDKKHCNYNIYRNEEENGNKSNNDAKNNDIIHNKEKLRISKNNNVISLNEIKDNRKHKIIKRKSLNKYKGNGNNYGEELFRFSVKSSSSSSKSTISSSSYFNPFSFQLSSLGNSTLDFYSSSTSSYTSSTSSYSSSSLSSSFSRSSNSINITQNSGSKKKKSPLHFFSYCNEGKIIPNKNSNVYNFPILNKKRKRNEKMNKKNISELDKKLKKSIHEKFWKIINYLINIDKEKNKGICNKKKNKKFIIKLLKIIYNNLLEIDLYIVDFITRKDHSKCKKDIFSYLKYNIKHNYNLNSNLRKWIIDSVLLDENERIQVKKDVKRSVNTWNVHKNNIFEIKKKYQYILKNIICSILYKHSNKIYYAQGVHDVCLVFITLYFHKFFLRYKKYVFLERFISKYVVNKICNKIFSKKYKNNRDYFISYPEKETNEYNGNFFLFKENFDNNSIYCNQKKLKKNKSNDNKYDEYNESFNSLSKTENFINNNSNYVKKKKKKS